MLIIADSSALVALASCNELELLDKRFDSVNVPDAVYRECTVKGKTGADLLSDYLNEKVISVDQSTAIITPSGLGAGELEAMALYKQQHADFLLIDDRRARKVAIYNGLNTIGSIGVLLWGKHNNYLESVRVKLERIQQAGIFLSDRVLKEALALAGED